MQIFTTADSDFTINNRNREIENINCLLRIIFRLNMKTAKEEVGNSKSINTIKYILRL